MHQRVVERDGNRAVVDGCKETSQSVSQGDRLLDIQAIHLFGFLLRSRSRSRQGRRNRRDDVVGRGDKSSTRDCRRLALGQVLLPLERLAIPGIVCV